MQCNTGLQRQCHARPSTKPANPQGTKGSDAERLRPPFPVGQPCPRPMGPDCPPASRLTATVRLRRVGREMEEKSYGGMLPVIAWVGPQDLPSSARPIR